MKIIKNPNKLLSVTSSRQTQQIVNMNRILIKITKKHIFRWPNLHVSEKPD